MPQVTRLPFSAAPCAGRERVPAADPMSRHLESTVYRFGVLVRSLGRRNGLDDAELDELLQAVRVRLWRALGQGETIPSITSSYVYQTALTAAIDIVRSRREGRFTTEDPARVLERVPGSSRPDVLLEESEAARRILQVIDQLPPDRRTAVKLHLAGYSREEIARMLEWSGARARNLIYRGLEQARRRLTQLGLGPGMGYHARRAGPAGALRLDPAARAGRARRLSSGGAARGGCHPPGQPA